MTSIPASRRARAMILAPRSWPSRPGLATTTRILRVDAVWFILELAGGLAWVAAGLKAQAGAGADRIVRAGAPRPTRVRGSVGRTGGCPAVDRTRRSRVEAHDLAKSR